jgi:hypothetical protein
MGMLKAIGVRTSSTPKEYFQALMLIAMTVMLEERSPTSTIMGNSAI